MVDFDVVTGSFGYIGRYITRELLDRGRTVRTITTHPGKSNPFGSQVEAYPLDFENRDMLIQNLQGVDCLYNTYWVRFEYRGMTFDKAVENTRIFFECAREAGVKKIIHVSVTRCDVSSPLPYYSGKARQEEALINCGVPYAIIRPTLVFGREDILVNNIAWLLRTFPLFPIFGSGDYKVQPVYVGDLARIAVSSSEQKESETLDAIGPESFHYRDMVDLIREAVGSRSIMVRTPTTIGIALGKLVGWALKDVILTKDEARGLMEEYLTSEQEPNGETRFSEWVQANHESLGKGYSSELERHFK